MNGIQKRKTRNPEKPFPGCLGRMVNLFDLSTGVAGNRLLTDKPHSNDSPLSRSQSDVSWMNPNGDQIEDKVIGSELRRTSSNRKSDGTPIKMLIAQEMSKEGEYNHNPSSVVAKLMGLDDLPRQQPDSASRRSHSRSYSRSWSEIPLGHWQQEHGFLETQVQHEIHHYPEQNESNDVYETWQQLPKTNNVRDKSPQKGRYSESANEKKMAFVRRKFIEAKRLATDEKLRKSKQFQDALEVLSSNKDLFLKFLQEPNSLFSQHLYNFQSIPPSSETKRITILKPSKMVNNRQFAGSGKNNENQIRKTSHVGQVNGWDKSNSGFSPPAASCNLDDNPTQPTRIVVLKPCPGKPQDIKAIDSPPSSSPRILHGEEFYEEPEDDKARESREVAKEITRQMRKNLRGHKTDETLFSSVCSNGYIGDESSFSKSEIECAAGNLSDLEVTSPASRHSWDYINRFDSPYSSSSFSRASYSPESSVCREAKKRLSERWSMMASVGNCQEQRPVWRSSSTLGEMLAISDMKNSKRYEEEGSNKEQELRGSTSCLISYLNQDEGVGSSPRNLLRSKSVPVSSTVYGSRLNVEVSDPEVRKNDLPKQLTKSRSVKSSFKGKVSNFFFSRNRKSSKEKSSQSKDEPQSAGIHSPGNFGDDRSQSVNDTWLEEGLLLSCKASSQNSIGVGPKQCITLPEAGFSVTKPLASGNPSDNQEQPSPNSVLEPPFEEDEHISLPFSGNGKTERHGVQLPLLPIQSNLIDKSPPIGSVARTLSWDNSCVETATPYPLKPSNLFLGAKEEEQEWFFLVQTLLSAAELDGEVKYNSFLASWHSPESPLDLSLRDEYIDPDGKEMVHKGMQRQQRSTRKLVFDCVNAALVDISGSHSRVKDGASLMTVDQVWARMKEWLSGEVRYVWGDGGDHHNLDVERVVRKEVVGKGWVEHLRLEMDNLGKEIEGKLLEELVQEAVTGLTGSV